MDLATDAGSGRYQILKRLAVGGMAEIYLARALGIEGFEKHVVLKRILPEYAARPEFVRMFLDEARLAATLHHQNIAQVYDIGLLDAQHFFTMEYLHGEDVRGLLRAESRRRGRVPLQYALTVAAGVASGLDHAHDKRGPDGTPLEIVHRDISPSNIVVTFAGAVKIVDFGVARAAQRNTETRTGGVKGKLSYLAPEQCIGERVDRRADVFALGILLWETTTMRRLFRHTREDADYVVMNRIVNGHVPRPRDIDADYPAELEAIVLRALATKREDRYQTARDLLIDLEAFAAQERIALSQAALSRYMEELFGRRPEPWLAEEIDEPEPETNQVRLKSPTGPPLPEGTIATAADRPELMVHAGGLALPLPAPEPTEVSGQDSMSGWFPVATPPPVDEEPPTERAPSSFFHGEVVLHPAPASEPEPEVEPDFEIPALRRRAGGVWIVVGVLAAAAIGAAVVLSRSDDAAPSEPAPAAPSTPARIVEPVIAAPPAPDAAPVVAAPPATPDAAPIAAAPAPEPAQTQPPQPERAAPTPGPPPRRVKRKPAQKPGPTTKEPGRGLIDTEW